MDIISDASELLTTEPVQIAYISNPMPLVEATIVARDSDAGGAAPYACTSGTCADAPLRRFRLLLGSGFVHGP